MSLLPRYILIAALLICVPLTQLISEPIGELVAIFSALAGGGLLAVSFQMESMRTRFRSLHSFRQGQGLFRPRHIERLRARPPMRMEKWPADLSPVLWGIVILVLVMIAVSLPVWVVLTAVIVEAISLVVVLTQLWDPAALLEDREEE